jgi:hypothetical protein
LTAASAGPFVASTIAAKAAADAKVIADRFISSSRHAAPANARQFAAVRLALFPPRD